MPTRKNNWNEEREINWDVARPDSSTSQDSPRATRRRAGNWPLAALSLFAASIVVVVIATVPGPPEPKVRATDFSAQRRIAQNLVAEKLDSSGELEFPDQSTFEHRRTASSSWLVSSHVEVTFVNSLTLRLQWRCQLARTTEGSLVGHVTFSGNGENFASSVPVARDQARARKAVETTRTAASEANVAINNILIAVGNDHWDKLGKHFGDNFDKPSGYVLGTLVNADPERRRMSAALSQFHKGYNGLIKIGSMRGMSLVETADWLEKHAATIGPLTTMMVGGLRNLKNSVTAAVGHRFDYSADAELTERRLRHLADKCRKTHDALCERAGWDSK